MSTVLLRKFEGLSYINHGIPSDGTSVDCLGSGTEPPESAHIRENSFNTWVVCPMCLQYTRIVRKPTTVERSRSL
jgi:hypothetical protein